MAYTGLTAKLSVGKLTGTTLDEKAVAYISNFSIEETKDIVEYTALGEDTKSKISTLYNWSANADGVADFTTVFYENDSTTTIDSTKTNQLLMRKAMIERTPIYVRFYLATDKIMYGRAYIESMSVDISAEDKANISISLTGEGKLGIKNTVPTLVDFENLMK